MPDPHVVQRHLLAITAHVAKLRRHVPITNESLQRNPDLLWVVERGLYLCIQNLLDCFAHIIAADFNEQWDTYAESSALLRQHGTAYASLRFTYGKPSKTVGRQAEP